MEGSSWFPSPFPAHRLFDILSTTTTKASNRAMSRLESVLAGLQRSSALQLVEEAQARISPLGPSLITALDDLLLAHQAHGRQQPSETTYINSLIPARGETVEVQGPPASGKTAFLLFEAMTMLVPAGITIESSCGCFDQEAATQHLEVNLGGRGPGKTVLLFALDHSSKEYAIHRLAHQLYMHLNDCLDQAQRIPDKAGSRSTQSIPPQVLDAIVAQWLSRCSVWTAPARAGPSVACELEMALSQAAAAADELAAGTEIALILVDSIEPLQYYAREEYERMMGTWPAEPAFHRQVPPKPSAKAGHRQLSGSEAYTGPTADPPLQAVWAALRDLQTRTKACLLLANGVEHDDPALRGQSSTFVGTNQPLFFAQPQSWPYPSPFRMNGASAVPMLHPASEKAAALPQKVGARDEGMLQVDWHITLHRDLSSGAKHIGRSAKGQAEQPVVHALLRQRQRGYIGAFGFALADVDGALVPM
ncbi:hypothetical protein V8E36_002689 [Tilletia maclaganii]